MPKRSKWANRLAAHHLAALLAAPPQLPVPGNPAYHIYPGQQIPQPAQRLNTAVPAAAGQAAAANGTQKRRMLEDSDDDIGDSLEDSHYASVTTDEFQALGLMQHPSPVSEAAALSSVKSPDVTYAVTLPGHVLRNISAVQFQAVRLACARHEVRLDSGGRGGFFLGDGPGVGKGRQISAIILNYFCRGKTKAVWVSVSGDLVQDAKRDLDDIGATDYEAVRLHDLRSLKVKRGQPLSALPGLDQGILFCTYDLLISGAKAAKTKGGKKGGKKAAWGKENQPPAGPLGLQGLGSVGGMAGYNAVFGSGAAAMAAKATAAAAAASSAWMGGVTGLAPQQAGGMFGNAQMGQLGFDQLLAEPGMAGGDIAALLRQQNGLDVEEEEAGPVEEFGPESRLHQIAEWLGDEDYVIVFDECHRAKNCVTPDQVKEALCPFAKEEDPAAAAREAGSGGQGGATNSKTARAVMELQNRLPNARFVYVSASGATEVDNLGYMGRLGLWGPGTAFSHKEAFVGALKSRGMAAMEMTAMELKQRGCYLARMLSYEGVEFLQKHVEVSPAFQDMYDAAALLWQDVRALALQAGLPKGGMRSFYAAQMRFFRQLCTAAKVDAVVDLATTYEAQGYAPVIGLQSTGEARTAAYVASHGGEDEVMDSFVEPAALVLGNWIEKWLEGVIGAGQLLRRAQALDLPKNPLDDLIERLGGPGAVAEMTGRKARLLKQEGGGYAYVKRCEEAATSADKVNILERELFQQGKRRFAIISDAASAGVSLHADRGAGNTRRRCHITLELAWSADKTVQQLGRTHRSNQVTPPLYIILSSNISGEWRFASAVARRLEQLGALTQGDRRAASSADALAQYNLQNKWAYKGLKAFYGVVRCQFIQQGQPEFGVSPAWLAEEMAAAHPRGLPAPEPNTPEWSALKEKVLNAWLPRAYNTLNAVGLFDAKSNKSNDPHKLLNRLLAVEVEMQSQVFQYFTAFMDNEVAMAKYNRDYTETGTIKPGCQRITLKSCTPLYTDPSDGATTQLLTFETDRGVSWDRAQGLLEEELERVREEEGEEGVAASDAGWYNSRNGTVIKPLLALPRSERGTRQVARGGGRRLKMAYYMRIIRPDTGFKGGDVNPKDFHVTYEKLNRGLAKSSWNAAYARRNLDGATSALRLLTGSLLRLLPVIGTSLAQANLAGRGGRQLQLMRVETSDTQQRYIGASVPHAAVDVMVANIQAAAAKKGATPKPGGAGTQQQQRGGLGGAQQAAAAAAGAAAKAPAVAAAPAAKAGSSKAGVAGAGAPAAAAGGVPIPQQQQQEEEKDGASSGGEEFVSCDSSDSEADRVKRRRSNMRRRRSAKGRRDGYKVLLEEKAAAAAAGVDSEEEELREQARRAVLQEEVKEKLQRSGMWCEPTLALRMQPKAEKKHRSEAAQQQVLRQRLAARQGGKGRRGRGTRGDLECLSSDTATVSGSSSGSEGEQQEVVDLYDSSGGEGQRQRGHGRHRRHPRHSADDVEVLLSPGATKARQRRRPETPAAAAAAAVRSLAAAGVEAEVITSPAAATEAAVAAAQEAEGWGISSRGRRRRAKALPADFAAAASEDEEEQQEEESAAAAGLDAADSGSEYQGDEAAAAGDGATGTRDSSDYEVLDLSEDEAAAAKPGKKARAAAASGAAAAAAAADEVEGGLAGGSPPPPRKRSAATVAASAAAEDAAEEAAQQPPQQRRKGSPPTEQQEQQQQHRKKKQKQSAGRQEAAEGGEVSGRVEGLEVRLRSEVLELLKGSDVAAISVKGVRLQLQARHGGADLRPHKALIRQLCYAYVEQVAAQQQQQREQQQEKEEEEVREEEGQERGNRQQQVQQEEVDVQQQQQKQREGSPADADLEDLEDPVEDLEDPVEDLMDTSAPGQLQQEQAAAGKQRLRRMQQQPGKAANSEQQAAAAASGTAGDDGGAAAALPAAMDVDEPVAAASPAAPPGCDTGDMPSDAATPWLRRQPRPWPPAAAAAAAALAASPMAAAGAAASPPPESAAGAAAGAEGTAAGATGASTAAAVAVGTPAMSPQPSVPAAAAAGGGDGVGGLPTAAQVSAAVREYLSGLDSFAGIKKKTVEAALQQRFATDLKPLRPVLSQAVNAWVKQQAASQTSPGLTASSPGGASQTPASSTGTPAAAASAPAQAASTAAAAAAAAAGAPAACPSPAAASAAGPRAHSNSDCKAIRDNSPQLAAAAAASPCSDDSSGGGGSGGGGGGGMFRKRRLVLSDSEEEEEVPPRPPPQQQQQQQVAVGSQQLGAGLSGDAAGSPDAAGVDAGDAADAGSGGSSSSCSGRRAAKQPCLMTTQRQAPMAGVGVGSPLAAAGPGSPPSAAGAPAAGPTAAAATATGSPAAGAPAAAAAGGPPPAAPPAAATDLDALVAAKVAAALAQVTAAAEARLAAELAAAREAFELQKQQLQEEKAALQAALAAAAAAAGGGSAACPATAGSSPVAAAAAVAAGSAAAAAVAAAAPAAGAVSGDSAFGDGSQTPVNPAVNPSQKKFDPAADHHKQAGAAAAAAAAVGVHQLLPQVAAAAVGLAAEGEQVVGVDGSAVSPGALITPLPLPSQRSQLATDHSPASAQPPVKPASLVDLTGQSKDQELTSEAVRAWLEEQPEGVSAPALVKHFIGCEQHTATTTTTSSSSSSRATQLAQVLQQLVDDMDVMRVGRAAAASALVDLGDATTLYTLV